jgi:hypothetical protein
MSPAASLLVAALAFHVDSGEYVNAVYNVMCLAQQASCTREKYDRLWKDELKWSAEDQTQLDRWMSIVRAAESREPAPPGAPLLANYPSFYPALRKRTAILAAALDAKSVDAFQTRASRLVPRDDAIALARALRHFQTRLAPWWRGIGRARVSGVRALDREFRPAVRNLFGQVASFVGADVLTAAHVHVVPSPDVGNDDANGTVVGNHFFMELVPTGSGRAAADEATKMVAGVAIHELTHALYDAAPTATHLAVMRQFAASTDPGSPSMYTLLNEAIATAVTGIVLELARGKDPEEGAGSDYRHPYIPRLERAATEPIRRALAAGRTMTDGFVDEYVRAARAILGDDADSLGFTFSAMAVIAGETLRPAAASFRQTIGPMAATDSKANWERIDELNAAFLLTYDEVREFADRIPDLPALMTHRGFAVMIPHKKKSHVVVLAGRDAAAVSEVIKQLQPSKPLSREGAAIVVD